MIVNVHVYPTSFKHESRILKETESIIRLGLAQKIIVMATHDKDLPVFERIDENREVRRIRQWIHAGFGSSKYVKLLSYIEFYIRLVWKCLFMKIDFINAHSLMVLPPCVAVKALKRAMLIYDPHELESERRNLGDSEKKISKWIESKLIGAARSVIVVGPKIADWYRDEYGINNVYVVRNIPKMPNLIMEKTPFLREKFNIPAQAIIFIYQGFLVSERGLEIILEAFKHCGPDRHVIFMGSGLLEDVIASYTSQYGNIHFQPAVHPSEIIKYTAGCDVGISLFENTCLSHYYVLPNKVFEYIKSSLPILVSNFPEMNYLIDKYQCGWTIPPAKEDLVRFISSVTHEEILNARKKSMVAAEDLDWTNEEKQIVSAFQKTL